MVLESHSRAGAPAPRNCCYRLETLAAFPSRELGNARDVVLALPDSPGPQPLLLLNDGQDLAALRALETLGALAAAGRICAPVVVAIPTNADRKMEYGLSHAADYAGRGARAGAYRRFVLEEVLPAVRARVGALRGRHSTAVLGASLGGLSAFDLAWNHPEVFGLCGVFSGSFWWRSDDTGPAAEQASRLAHRLVREAAEPLPAVRFWFQAGTEDETDDRDGNGVIDAIQDTTELIDELALRGWRRERDAIYHEVAGGRHDTATWAQVLGEFAQFAFR